MIEGGKDLGFAEYSFEVICYIVFVLARFDFDNFKSIKFVISFALNLIDSREPTRADLFNLLKFTTVTLY